MGDKEMLITVENKTKNVVKAALVMVITTHFQCCCTEDSPTMGLFNKENRNLV